MKKPNYSVGDLVRILWEDPCGFVQHAEQEMKPSQAWNVGYVAAIKPDFITVKAGGYEDTDVSDGTAIVKGCITKVEVLVKGKK